jgi:hypothetical protein
MWWRPSAPKGSGWRISAEDGLDVRGSSRTCVAPRTRRARFSSREPPSPSCTCFDALRAASGDVPTAGGEPRHGYRRLQGTLARGRARGTAAGVRGGARDRAAVGGQRIRDDRDGLAVLRWRRRARPREEKRRYTVPRWVRTARRGPRDARAGGPRRTGVLRHLDLANLDSVAMLQTADLGSVHGDGFELLLGRAPGAEPRGCSIAMDELLQAIGQR